MRCNRFLFSFDKTDLHKQRKREEGVLFQDSLELAGEVCENNTKDQAAHEIVNKGINGFIKKAFDLTRQSLNFREVCLNVRHCRST